MTTTSLIERHQDKMVGVLNGIDRIVVTGTLPDCCHAGAMMAQLVRRKIRFFDYGTFVDPLRNRLPINAKTLAAQAGLDMADSALTCTSTLSTSGWDSALYP